MRKIAVGIVVGASLAGAGAASAGEKPVGQREVQVKRAQGGAPGAAGGEIKGAQKLDKHRDGEMKFQGAQKDREMKLQGAQKEMKYQGAHKEGGEYKAPAEGKVRQGGASLWE